MPSPRTAPDPKRRVHLGIRRRELHGRRWERHFRWQMDPLPEPVEEALRRGPGEPSDGLDRKQVNRLLEPGAMALETGYTTLPNGTAHVAVHTLFPGGTGAMIDWWFGWHGDETERYKLWHPQSHLFTQWRDDRSEEPALTDREKYLGNTSYVDEYIGGGIQRLAICFRKPRELGLAEERFEQAGVSTAICARVGLSDRPLDTGYLIHLIRDTVGGCEMRSRFWLGEAHLRFLPEGNPVDRILNSGFVRRRLPTATVARELLIHCAEEMNHLASFLPALYAEEAGSVPTD